MRGNEQGWSRRRVRRGWAGALAASVIMAATGCEPSHPTTVDFRGKTFERVVDRVKDRGVAVSTYTPGGEDPLKAKTLMRFLTMGNTPADAVSKINNWMDGTPDHIVVDGGSTCRVFSHEGLMRTVLSHVVMAECGYKGVCGFEIAEVGPLEPGAPDASSRCAGRTTVYAELSAALDAR